MGSKLFKIWLVSLLILFSHTLFAQKRYQSRRWRLDFESDPPKSITIVQPDGKKDIYWYVRYKIINNTPRNIPWMFNIKLVIDKVREGVAIGKVPEVFFNATFPAGVNKEQYMKNLRAYYDVNLPVVKKEILSRLKLYPRFSKNTKAVLSALDSNTPKDVISIMEEVGLSYEETETCLNRLVVNNLAISQEAKGNPIFVRGTLGHTLFIVNDKEVKAKAGDKIAGWTIVSFDRNRVVMKKGDVITSFCKGSTIEYLYAKTLKRVVERDTIYFTGMDAKGTYKGRIPKKEVKKGKKYLFETNVIPKKSIRHGIAIFSNVSEEMDFMAIVVSGLVDPIVKRNRKVYVENEVMMVAYKRLGDEYHSDRDTMVHLYKKNEVLSTYELDRKTGKTFVPKVKVKKKIEVMTDTKKTDEKKTDKDEEGWEDDDEGWE